MYAQALKACKQAVEEGDFFMLRFFLENAVHIVSAKDTPLDVKEDFCHAIETAAKVTPNRVMAAYLKAAAHHCRTSLEKVA